MPGYMVVVIIKRCQAYENNWLPQDELAQAGKRKAGNASGAKQRSILDFFKTPPSAQGPKRRKVGPPYLPGSLAPHDLNMN